MSDTSHHGARAHLGTTIRIVAAAATLVAGLVHLQLYFDGYRDVPDANLGRSFLLHAAASALVAAALVLRRDAVVRLAGIGLSVGALVAFALSRTDRGIFGFTETGFQPSPQAQLAVGCSILAIGLLAATFAPGIGAGEELRSPLGVGAAVAVVVVTLAGAAVWSQASDTDDQATAATATDPADPAATTGDGGDTGAAAPDGVVTIRIADFAFDGEAVEVPVGTTVEWVNEDTMTHTVVADGGAFASDNLRTGDRFTFSFDTAGTFEYFCGVHPSMRGTIVVTP